LKQSISEKVSAEKDLIIKNDERARLINEQAEWTYLRNACSKDGLRQLEFDGVAPVISGYANELLNMSFKLNDLVKFRTQDDEGREDLQIIVLRDEEVLLDDLCGGEEVIILKALRLAMTLISQDKSGKRYEAIFCDEEDGALSVENATKFIHMYKSLMKIGGIETCFYISHKPEAVALADHVLDFSNEGVRIQ
jgi:DNA repair exonuclease SbcCD ATPase subunit